MYALFSVYKINIVHKAVIAKTIKLKQEFK